MKINILNLAKKKKKNCKEFTVLVNVRNIQKSLKNLLVKNALEFIFRLKFVLA